MSVLRNSLSKPARTRLLEPLTEARRRRILAVLSERSGPTTEGQLAELVAAGSDDPVESVKAELRHTHLPKLADAGLVGWDRSKAVVLQGDHPAFGDDWFEGILDAEGEGLDATIAALSDEHRRAVLAVLERRNGPQILDELAREIVDRKPGETGSVDDVRVQLHHTHLPKLADAGLVEYEDGTVTYLGSPDLPVEEVSTA